MKSIVIKIVDRDKPELVAQAEGELEGAEFAITYKEACDFLGVDAQKHGNGEQTYNSSVVIIGQKIVT